MNMSTCYVGDTIPFYMYVHGWMHDYPHLDVYYHMHYIEQAYTELYL